MLPPDPAPDPPSVMRPWLGLPLFVCLVAASVPAAAQEPSARAGETDREPDVEPAGLFGHVVLPASGEPVPGAEVRLLLHGRTAVTDESGSFRFDGLLPGPEVMQIRFLGRVTAPDTIVLVAGVHLRARRGVPQADLPAMEELVVRVRRTRTRRERRRERFDREARGIGHRYVDRAWLRELDPPELSWVLPYLSLSVDRFDNRLALATRGPTTIYGSKPGRSTSGLGCVPALYVNDVYWGTPDLQVVDAFDPDDVVGMVTYRRPFVPARYRSRATTCGALVIWTE